MMIKISITGDPVSDKSRLIKLILDRLENEIEWFSWAGPHSIQLELKDHQINIH